MPEYHVKIAGFDEKVHMDVHVYLHHCTSCSQSKCVFVCLFVCDSLYLIMLCNVYVHADYCTQQSSVSTYLLYMHTVYVTLLPVASPIVFLGDSLHFIMILYS